MARDLKCSRGAVYKIPTAHIIRMPKDDLLVGQ
jgi:hypothetical protein